VASHACSVTGLAREALGIKELLEERDRFDAAAAAELHSVSAEDHQP
jgi:hypothetical protein